MTDQRKAALAAYIESLYGKCELASLNGDASFRRYFRTPFGIAVDAPPASQKNREFVAIDKALLAIGLKAPQIFNYDLEQGFLVQEDLGDRSFYSALNADNLESMYLKAASLLPKLSKLCLDLPEFDGAFIDMELGIFTEWMLDKTLNLKLSSSEQQALDKCFAYIKNVCLSCEQLPMHRDFHCRNLMLYQDELYLIDFQDMVKGPLGYDLASLVYDCYLNLPNELIDIIIRHSFEAYQAQGYLQNQSLESFTLQLKIISLQRHLKVLGIFRRLYLRDGKSGYLKDLPRVLAYAQTEAQSSPKLAFLAQFLAKYLEGKIA